MNVVRPALDTDIDAMVRLHALWPELARWTREHFQDELGVQGRYLCVLDSPGGLLGYGAMRFLAQEAELLGIAVKTRGLGYGRALMEHLHGKAMDCGCEVMRLEVGAANGYAIAFYKGLGYRIVGRRPNYYNDTSDALLMDLVLRPR